MNLSFFFGGKSASAEKCDKTDMLSLEGTDSDWAKTGKKKDILFNSPVLDTKLLLEEVGKQRRLLFILRYLLRTPSG